MEVYHKFPYWEQLTIAKSDWWHVQIVKYADDHVLLQNGAFRGELIKCVEFPNRYSPLIRSLGMTVARLKAVASS